MQSIIDAAGIAEKNNQPMGGEGNDDTQPQGRIPGPKKLIIGAHHACKCYIGSLELPVELCPG